MSRSMLLLAAACLVTPARAQITITHADLEAALSIEGTNTLYSTESAVALAALAAQTGSNQTWDFTGLTYSAPRFTEVTRVQPPVPGSSDAHLAQASHIFEVVSDDSTVYTFQTLSTTEAGFLGLSGPSVLVRFIPTRVDAVLPFTFGTIWSSSYETQFEPGFPAGVTMSTMDSHEVVGWGTLVTPDGSAPALMIRTETTNTLNFPPLPPIVTSSSQVLFTAYGLLNANVYLSAGGPATGDYNVYEAQTASEPDAASGFVRLRVEHNPVEVGRAIAFTFVLPSAASVSLDVYDAAGRRAGAMVADATYGAGAHRIEWAGSALPAGVYLARLRADGHTSTRAFTVDR